MKEHNPNTCSICQRLGNYSQYSIPFNGKTWWKAHKKAGFNLQIRLGCQNKRNPKYEMGIYSWVIET